MNKLDELLQETFDSDYISDLHLTTYDRPYIRRDGRLKPIEDHDGRLEKQEMEDILQELMSPANREEFEKRGEVDFSYDYEGRGRFRVNVFKQMGITGVALRVIPAETPDIEDYRLPGVLKSLAAQERGFILSTGPTGSGKSTTQAAIINEINNTREAHIVTLEDPIEYLHENDKSLIRQREVGTDTTSFARGLRAALRQDPDVILVGEMRDLETIRIALEAAETGHLVLATLHTNSAPASVDRIIDVFPANQQDQVRVQLASVLSAIIAQQLLPRGYDEGQIAAFEILIATPAVRNIIREGKSSQLYTAIQTGGKKQMTTMDNYLIKLLKRREITRDTVMRYCFDHDYVKKALGRN